MRTRNELAAEQLQAAIACAAQLVVDPSLLKKHQTSLLQRTNGDNVNYNLNHSQEPLD